MLFLGKRQAHAGKRMYYGIDSNPTDILAIRILVGLLAAGAVLEGPNFIDLDSAHGNNLLKLRINYQGGLESCNRCQRRRHGLPGVLWFY